MYDGGAEDEGEGAGGFNECNKPRCLYVHEMAKGGFIYDLLWVTVWW